MERRLAGRYELREQLGDSTWLAADRELERDVVVRFGEVAGATLSHPSLARVFDQGEEGGESYAVLEYLPGGTLAERRALTEESAAGLAAGLAYAHEQGVPHGAVSADAILFDAEGRAKLTGFTGAGDPAADLAALSALRSEYAVTEVRRPEAATAVVPPPPPPPERRSRRGLVAAIVAALLLAAAGTAAALLAGGDDDGGSGPTLTTDPITSATAPTDTGEEPAPPPTTTGETTTTATTETEPATTETQPSTTDTIAPPVPTEPPLPSIPATTELPTEPVTTVQEPPPPTTTTTDTQE